MFLFLSKAIPPFLIPPGVNLVLFVAAWILKRRAPRLAAGLFTLSTVILVVASSGLGSGALIEPLESSFPRVNAEQLPSADAIVVLGGYLRHARPDQRAQLTDSADRLWFAAQLYRAGKAPVVLLAGGNVSFLTGDVEPESVAAARVIESMGVPASAVQIEQNSRNTHENAVDTASVLGPQGQKRILLVTSAFHQRRASALFRKVGLNVIPAPCDHLTSWSQPNLLFRILPEAGNLGKTQIGLREWIGLAVYKMRGWI